MYIHCTVEGAVVKEGDGDEEVQYGYTRGGGRQKGGEGWYTIGEEVSIREGRSGTLGEEGGKREGMSGTLLLKPSNKIISMFVLF